MEDSSWPEESRAALLGLARLAPVLAESTHGSAPDHAKLRDSTSQRVQLQHEMQSVFCEVEEQLSRATAGDEAIAEHLDTTMRALATADARHSDSGRPSLAALLAQMAHKQRVLEMQQTVARELLLLSGCDWAGSETMQRAVVRLDAITDHETQ